MSALKPCRDVIRHGRDGDVFEDEVKLAELKGLQWTEIGLSARDHATVEIKYGAGMKPVTIMGFSDEPHHLEREDKFWSGKDMPE